MFEGALRVDKQDPLPRHAQVQRILREMVTSGRLRPGDKIPAEVEIAEQLGVSKMTVNKAILALTADGFFIREVGRGTFVSDRPAAATSGRPVSVSRGDQPRILLSFVEGATNILESHYYSSLYRAVQETLGGLGVEVEVSLATLSAEDYRAEDRRAAADGWLIIAPRADSITTIEGLWNQGRNLVVVGASWPSMGVPSVDSDNVGGAMEAVRHLAGLGHQRIALLYAEEETANTQDRILGYRRALSLAGLPHSAAGEVRAEQAWRAGAEAKSRLITLFQGPEPVTAVFAAGYYLALEAMNAAREARKQVPEEVSVVGFDDPLSAQLVYPPLTTVRQPLYEMGKRAAERLVRLSRGQEPRSLVREVLPAQLVVRRSTVPPVVTAAR